MPAPPAAPLAPRRPTRQLHVGSVGVGSEYPISVQSMTTTLTADVNATLQQIAELTASGCDIVRVACPSQDDADALPAIARKSQIPVIADIHFQPKYVFAAIEAGCAAVRVNPGNIRKFDDQVKEIAANTYLGWKWMSAMTGICDFFAMAGSASASSAEGTATRTMSQPAAVSSAICWRVALTSEVSVVVIDWTDTGWSLPTPTPPTSSWRVLRRGASTAGASGRPRSMVISLPCWRT